MSLNPFRPMMAVFIAVFLGVGMLTSAPSYGAIVAFEFDVNDNEIIDFDTDLQTSIELVKVFNDPTPLSPLEFSFKVDSTDSITIEEVIVNRTGITWFDFHFEIIFGDAEFASAVGFDPPFGNADTSSPKAVWLSGGTVPDNAAFSITLVVDVLSTADFIVIEQLPTVPIPAALWLFGSGLLVLVGAARRRKMV